MMLALPYSPLWLGARYLNVWLTNGYCSYKIEIYKSQILIERIPGWQGYWSLVKKAQPQPNAQQKKQCDQTRSQRQQNSERKNQFRSHWQTYVSTYQYFNDENYRTSLWVFFGSCYFESFVRHFDISLCFRLLFRIWQKTRFSWLWFFIFDLNSFWLFKFQGLWCRYLIM